MDGIIFGGTLRSLASRRIRRVSMYGMRTANLLLIVLKYHASYLALGLINNKKDRNTDDRREENKG
jgi:hypothetical protein